MLDLFLSWFVPTLGASLGIAVGASFTALAMRLIDEYFF